MFAFPRLLSFAAAAMLPLLHTTASAEPLILGPPAAKAPTTPATATPPAATPTAAETARAANAEHLQVALRKLQAGEAGDSAAAHEVAFYQTREAVLTQLE